MPICRLPNTEGGAAGPAEQVGGTIAFDAIREVPAIIGTDCSHVPLFETLVARYEESVARISFQRAMITPWASSG